MKKQEQNWIELDGANGEGGGQILRSALSLSMITGIPFRISRIRAGRDKPGLLRQHLTAVLAAASVCDARVSGAELGSQTLSFEPGPIRGGDYRFAIGTAGSATLVLQTVLPALWHADAPATVRVTGGTHNRAAPPADFLIRAWQPLMQRMGVSLEIVLNRYGFYPAGGGEVVAHTAPCSALQPLHVLEKGERLGLMAEAVVASVPGNVARRELDRVKAQIAMIDDHVRQRPNSEGPGNVLMLTATHANVTEVFCGFGERGLSAEKVADHTAHALRQYLESPAAVGEFLADQLLLPLALAGGGSFTTNVASSHLRTQAQIVELFLPVEIEIRAESEQCWRVEVRG
ncbi:RNA 3'-terminal phosphate cyclase [Burkholderiaceae bacterium DAT-1]|nr:RNA 3'-terminal phosphate cyclase [Burkholderiaceae bacterium DAT-1]